MILREDSTETTVSKITTKDNWMAVMYCNNKHKFTAYIGNYLPTRLMKISCPNAEIKNKDRGMFH